MHRITPDLPISSDELLEKVMSSGEKDVGITKRGLGPNGFDVGIGEKGGNDGVGHLVFNDVRSGRPGLSARQS
jgi:hypothetical protein